MVDIENRLLGIITIDDIIDVIEQEDTEDFHRMAGISSPVEEIYLKTSAFTMARQRIMWLVVLMISATFTGRIIKSYEDVLQSVVEYTGGECWSTVFNNSNSCFVIRRCGNKRYIDSLLSVSNISYIPCILCLN